MFYHLITKLKSELGQANAPDDDGKPAGDQGQSKSQQAEKLEGLIADIDLSDVPEEQRGTVKKFLTDKVKLYDAGFRAKTEDLSKERKAIEDQKKQVNDLVSLREEIQGNPQLEKEVTKLINQARAGILGKESSDKSLKTLDKLIENADPKTERSLRQLRQIVNEETSSFSEAREQIKHLENEIKSLKSLTTASQSERVESKINQLRSRFGEVVDKYADEIRGSVIKYPSQDPEKLFRYYASDDDLKTAYLQEIKTQKEREEREKLAGSSAGGKDVRMPIEVEKDKFGRTNYKNVIKKILAKNS